MSFAGREVKRVEKQILGKVGKEMRRAEQKVEGVFKGPKIPKVIPPELPPPVATPRQISEQAQRAGGAERRRIRGRRGRLTIFAGRRDLAPAVVSQAGLKTTFG